MSLKVSLGSKSDRRSFVPEDLVMAGVLFLVTSSMLADRIVSVWLQLEVFRNNLEDGSYLRICFERQSFPHSHSAGSSMLIGLEHCKNGKGVKIRNHWAIMPTEEH